MLVSGGDPVEGVVINYRRGRRTVYGNQIIVEIPGVSSRDEAARFVGKKVRIPWLGPEFVGKIMAPHGNNGRVRVRFDIGIPGQAIGKRVEVVE